MLEESVVGKAIALAKSAGLAVTPAAAGLLLGATATVLLIGKGGELLEKVRGGAWDWWRLVPCCNDAVPKE